MPSLHVSLPPWTAGVLPPADHRFDSDADAMALAVALADGSWRHGTGGPFGAVIIDERERTLVAAGVNMVVPGNAAILHAEMVAIALAGQVVGSYAVGTPERPAMLVTSTEPCAMCYGATVWSGVHALVCGATDADARGIGFDEGPKLDDWQHHLRIRGIEVREEVLRDRAAAVLREYGVSGGEIYNG